MPDEAIPQTAEGGDGGTAEETQVNTPAERQVVEPTSSAPDGQRPGIAAIWAEAAKEADESGSDDEGDGTPADDTTPPAGDETPEGEGTPDAEGDTPATDDEPDTASAAEVDAEAAKKELDDLLATYDDPEVLNAALKKAGTQKVSELPEVKALIGRISQSVRDQTRAEIEKAQREAAQLAEVTEAGKQAKDKFIAALDKLAADIEAGEDDLSIPTADAIKDAFEDYAGSAVGEYHTKAWNVLSDQLYSVPEMGGPMPTNEDGTPVTKTQPPDFTQEQADLLNAVKGADPGTWLAAHLAVQRDRLWGWAQAEAAANGGETFNAEKVQIQAAHQREIAKLTKAHEEAVKTAREEARAEALAERASGKTPPRTPQNKTPKDTSNEATLDDAIPAGASIAEIRRIVKAKTEAGVEV